MTSRQQNRRRWVWFAIGVFIAVAVTIIRNRPRSLAARVTAETMEVDGEIRQYRQAVPVRVQGAGKIPLVVALHGAMDSVDQMAHSTELDYLAAEHGFLLVYLQGRMNNWPPFIPEENPDVALPDLKFFDAVVDRFVEDLNANPHRVYVVGVSQGGAMCNLIVALRSEKIAAGVCNCGWLPKPLDECPLPTIHKSPMLFIVGSKDQQVSSEVVKRAEQAFAQSGHPTQFLSLPGAGHGWNKDRGVNSIVWDFLKQHQLEP